jgi:hypothetical protein
LGKKVRFPSWVYTDILVFQQTIGMKNSSDYGENLVYPRKQTKLCDERCKRLYTTARNLAGRYSSHKNICEKVLLGCTKTSHWFTMRFSDVTVDVLFFNTIPEVEVMVTTRLKEDFLQRHEITNFVTRKLKVHVTSCTDKIYITEKYEEIIEEICD